MDPAASYSKRKMSKRLPCTAHGELKLSFDPTSMFAFVSQICETLDLHQYDDILTMERFPWIHRFQYIEMWKRLLYTTNTKTKMRFDPTFHVYLCLSNLSGKHWIFINGDLLIRLE
jgi:hypothetical protein